MDRRVVRIPLSWLFLLTLPHWRGRPATWRRTVWILMSLQVKLLRWRRGCAGRRIETPVRKATSSSLLGVTAVNSAQRVHHSWRGVLASTVTLKGCLCICINCFSPWWRLRRRARVMGPLGKWQLAEVVLPLFVAWVQGRRLLFHWWFFVPVRVMGPCIVS